MKVKKKTIKNKNWFYGLVKFIGENSYRVFGPEDKETKEFFNYATKSSIFCVCTTGCTTKIEFKCEDFLVPEDQQVLITKEIKYDQSHGLPHLNSYFYAFIPNKNGEVVQVSLKDKFKEHIVEINDTHEDFYTLVSKFIPKNKKGSVSELYSKNKFPTVGMEVKDN
ncbi:MAG: hypothetical protein WC576_04400 [Candidatus Omnitrophota bacterium]|jgi:hypothetical protein